MSTAVAALTNTSAAVLGMVSLGQRSGYQIRRASELSVRFFWALGPPQIYSELKRLEAAGLLSGAEDARGERARRVYEVTDAGRAALRDWLAADEPSPMELRDGEILRLFFSDATTPEQAQERIAVLRERSASALRRFEREILPEAAALAEAVDAAYPAHAARFGRDLHRFIVDWCDDFTADPAE